MRNSSPFRLADGSDQAPVWARARRTRRNPVVGALVMLLALFGVLTGVLGVKERSLAGGGALMDGWIAAVMSTVKGEAPRIVDKAEAAAGSVAGKAQDAAQAGAAAASDEIRKQ